MTELPTVMLIMLDNIGALKWMLWKPTLMEFTSHLIAVALTHAMELLEMLVFKILKDGALAINGVMEEDMEVDTVKVLTTLNLMDHTNILIPQNHSISNRTTFPLVNYISLLLL